MLIPDSPGRSFTGQVALVTGGGSGIGRATALAFARAGARVVVADLDPEGGEETVSLITGLQEEAIFTRTDVSRAPDVEEMVRQTVERFGRLDCAHNNAGVMAGGIPLEEYTTELWDSIIAVNLTGTWLCMKHEITQMRSQRRGAIVNTSSVLGLRGFAGAAAYAASKHGIIGLTRVAAREGASAGIRVNAVCPSWIRTPPVELALAFDPGREEQLTAAEPLERLGTPEEVAAAVVWLCSDAASFITGHSLVIDGGLSV